MRHLRLLRIAFLLAVFCTSAALAASAQTFGTLEDFDGSDGSAPWGGSLVQGVNGHLYGTTSGGGTNNSGTIFELSTHGLKTLYNFCPTPGCPDGSFPAAGLALGSDGKFYGTTNAGGIGTSCQNGCGTVFVITPNGKLTTLYNFCSLGNCADGSQPIAGLVQGTDGNFYGVTPRDGQYGNGTTFRITPSGNLTTIYSFCAQSNCLDGSDPAGLVLGTDGNFYGATSAGGGNIIGGTIFKMTRAGAVTTLYSFCSLPGCADGAQPGGLMEANDGNLYGVATFGGASSNSGTVFRLTRQGKFSTIYTFCAQNPNCPDGARPTGVLVDTNNPNASLFGTTQWGGTGAAHGGTVFQMTYNGALTTVHSFCQKPGCSDGATPFAGVFQGTDGNLYGTTNVGGSGCESNGCGTIYWVEGEGDPFVQPVPRFGRVGHTIGILGNNLKQTSSVTFNGVSASFNVVSDTLIRATVPNGAATGPIQITTSQGVLDSNVNFYVLP